MFPVGRGTSCIQLTLSLKAPGFNPCAYEVETWFQTFAFKFNLYRYIPEHKYIVEALRQQGFLAGMTDDGVNDAPVGLYKLNSGYPQLESAWFQPFKIKEPSFGGFTGFQNHTSSLKATWFHNRWL